MDGLKSKSYSDRGMVGGGVISEDSVGEFVKSYVQQANSLRKEYGKLMSAKWRRRKAYRGNPWR